MFLARLNDYVSTVTPWVASDCAVSATIGRRDWASDLPSVRSYESGFGLKGTNASFSNKSQRYRFWHRRHHTALAVCSGRSNTGPLWRNPSSLHETLAGMDPAKIEPGDVVGIGIHTANALRGYGGRATGPETRSRVIYGGVHASLHPEERTNSAALTASLREMVTGFGSEFWPIAKRVIHKPLYDGGRIAGDQLQSARWNLFPL